MITMTTETHHETATPAEVLQLQHAAMRVSFTWLGTRKALDIAHKAEIAEDFEADAQMVSASKKLFDTRYPAYRAVAKIKREIAEHWKHSTLPFPEPGIRLLPQAKMEEFDDFMQDAHGRLRSAVDELQEHYGELREKARIDLGRLFNESDYPTDVTGLFDVTWNVENVSPPDYLMEIKPEWYEREVQRIRGLFNQAVEATEREFIEEFSKLVASLTERLTDNEDGTPKVYRKDCVDKLKGFIERFRDLSIHSNDDLEKLVGECDRLTRGVDGHTFRDLPDIRQHVAEKLAAVKEAMDRDLTLVPRRRITRRPAPKG